LLLRTRCVFTVSVDYDSKLIGEVEAHKMVGVLELEKNTLNLSVYTLS